MTIASPHERFWAKVDKSGECWLWTGGKAGKGYGYFYYEGKMRYAHRVAYTWFWGALAEGMMVDHTCHNPACVRPLHLRAVTSKQNQENRQGAQSNGKSGVRGVTWSRFTNQWQAQVQHNGKNHFLGRFDSLEEAQQAASKKRLELFTHNNKDRIDIS